VSAKRGRPAKSSESLWSSSGRPGDQAESNRGGKPRAQLESEFHAELHNSGSTHRVADCANIEPVLKVVIGCGEVDIVEEVEDFPSELEVHVFNDLRRLRQAEIKSFLIWPAKNVAAQVAEIAKRARQRIDVEERFGRVRSSWRRSARVDPGFKLGRPKPRRYNRQSPG
jgi:hypothetical protein